MARFISAPASGPGCQQVAVSAAAGPMSLSTAATPDLQPAVLLGRQTLIPYVHTHCRCQHVDLISKQMDIGCWLLHRRGNPVCISDVCKCPWPAWGKVPNLYSPL